MLSYIDQIRAARVWHQHVAETLHRAEQAIRSARESWPLLPRDVEEVGLWCRELEVTCLELLALLDEVRSSWRAHSSSPLPHPTPGGSCQASPLPPDSPEAA